MYLDFEVKIPKIPGKIGRFTKGGTTYVWYVADRIYHPDMKYNIPNHKTIIVTSQIRKMAKLQQG